jgi:hypothetical protein
MRRPGRAAAAIVALALLLGGMPLTLGVVVHSSEAMFTLDICHPVQSFSHSPVAVVAIIPGAVALAQCLAESRRYAVPRTTTLSARVPDAPDPPPPKALA